MDKLIRLPGQKPQKTLTKHQYYIILMSKTEDGNKRGLAVTSPQ